MSLPCPEVVGQVGAAVEASRTLLMDHIWDHQQLLKAVGLLHHQAGLGWQVGFCLILT